MSRRPSDGVEADFRGTGWADTPGHNAFVVGGDYESPTRQQSGPRRDFDGGTAGDVLKRVVD